MWQDSRTARHPVMSSAWQLHRSALHPKTDPSNQTLALFIDQNKNVDKSPQTFRGSQCVKGCFVLSSTVTFPLSGYTACCTAEPPKLPGHGDTAWQPVKSSLIVLKTWNYLQKSPLMLPPPSLLRSGLQDSQDSIPKSSAQSESFGNLF